MWALFQLLGIEEWVRQVHALNFRRHRIDQEATTQAYTDRRRCAEQNEARAVGANDWRWG